MTDTPQTIAIIVALDEQNAIGSNGDLLCHLPSDLKHFKKITTGYAVIMGRKTYESLFALSKRRFLVAAIREKHSS